jgi:hypothetical protein
MPLRRRRPRSRRSRFIGCSSLRNRRILRGRRILPNTLPSLQRTALRRRSISHEERFKIHSTTWSHPLAYGPCQALADAARMASVEVIRYQSVRDPRQGMNLALLTCRTFAKPEPVGLQTWRIHLGGTGAQAICESPKSGIAFDRATFAADPRVAVLRWTR